MPSPWGEGAPKGRMRGPHRNVEKCLIDATLFSPHQSQSSLQLLCDSFPPGGSDWVLPHQNNRTINCNLHVHHRCIFVFVGVDFE